MIVTKKDKFRTDEKVLVECDFKISPKCKGKYLKLYKNILKCRINNDGKDRCQYCFNTSTKTGNNNYNFKYDKEENFFENIDTELKAYMLGWIAGDGHVKKDGLYFSVHPVDIDILILFQKNIAPTTNIMFDERDNTVQWKINSVKIVQNILKQLELKTYGKKFDKIKIPFLEETFLWAFVRGLFDSDGHISSLEAKNTSPICSICSVSVNMQNDLMNLMNKYNIKYIKSEGYPQIQFTGIHCIKFLDQIYKNSNFSLHRKRALWKIWQTWKPFYGTIFKPRKHRIYYPPISNKQKKAITLSNKKRKGTTYERNKVLCN